MMHNTVTEKSNRDIRVLVVEDDYLVAREIHYVLEKIGYKIVGDASNGNEAVKKTAALRPDVVLMDIRMPEKNGLEATAEIQQTCPTPVVIMTAYDSGELLEKANGAGAGAYLIKPPVAPEVQRAITIAMGRHGDMMALKKLVAEKENLIREIHHRVKNHLTVIKSLLRLQSGQMDDERGLDALRDAEGRIRSIGLIHENLYRSDNYISVNLPNYVRRIVFECGRMYDKEGKIGIVVDVQDVKLDVKIIMPCGLIINELVTNVYKYAFPESKRGTCNLTVTLKCGGGGGVLSVQDNGRGIPPDDDLDKKDSLGLKLVRMLTGQLEGQLNVRRQKGTTFEITFPLETEKETEKVPGPDS